MVWQLITNPDAFMDRRMHGRTLKLELIVVVLCGLAGAIGFFYLGQQLDEALPAELAYFEFELAAHILKPILILLIAWFGYTFIAHYFAQRAGARSPWTRLLKVTSWALVPLGIGYLIRSAAIIAAHMLNPPDVDVAEIGTGEEAIQVYIVEEMLTEPLVIGATLLMLLALAWTGYLFALAIKNTKELPWDTAWKIAAVPVVIHAISILRFVWIVGV